MNDDEKNDSEATTQPSDNTEIEILKKELEILRKENVMLKIKNDCPLNEDESDKYKTRKLPHPDDPEIKVMKSLLPVGQSLSTQRIAELLQIDFSITQNHLDILEEKGWVKPKHSTKSAFGARRPTTYSLTKEGLDYLAKNKLL